MKDGLSRISCKIVCYIFDGILLGLACIILYAFVAFRGESHQMNQRTDSNSHEKQENPIPLARQEWEVLSTLPNLVHKKLIFDVMSIGSKTRPEYLHAQKETFGSYEMIRKFFEITEDDDVDKDCQDLTTEDANKITELCLDPESIKALEAKHPVLAQVRPYYNEKHRNKPGWLCAQKRPSNGLQKVLRIYEKGVDLPDYLLIIDDDTFLSLSAVHDFVYEQYGNSSEPIVMAGCLDRWDTRMGMPWGGFGTFISKAALKRLAQPVDCGTGKEDGYSHEVCQRIQDDLFGERKYFRDGMSVADLIEAYVSAENFSDYRSWSEGFCLQSDMVWGYFLNFYPIAGKSTHPNMIDGVEQNHRMCSYQDSNSNYLEVRRRMFHHNLNGQCEFDGEDFCGKDSHICHYMSPQGMHRVFESDKRQGSTPTSKGDANNGSTRRALTPKEPKTSRRRNLKSKKNDPKSSTYRDPKETKAPKARRNLKSKKNDPKSSTYRDPKETKAPKARRNLKRPARADAKAAREDAQLGHENVRPGLNIGELRQDEVSAHAPGGQPSRPRNYNVKAIIMPARVNQAHEHLDTIFPDIDYIAAFDKDDVDLGLMELVGTYNREWDNNKIRDAFMQDYANEGEVACTLSHRRALEKFLHDDGATEVALILEDDSVPISDDILAEIDSVLLVAPERWEFIQLGRCWDLWCHKDEAEDPIAWFSVAHGHGENNTRVGLHHSRGYELCSHAYLVTRKGAEKLLQHTLPVILPYDHTSMLLGREGVLDEYFTSPRLFVQKSHKESLIGHNTGGTPECDEEGQERAKNLFKDIWEYDFHIMQTILNSPAQNMISLETRRLKDVPFPTMAELERIEIMSNLCKEGKSKFCVSEEVSKSHVAQNCHILGGSSLDGTKTLSEPSRAFLERLDSAALKGVIIWGLQPDQDHTHAYVHFSIYRAIEEAMMHSTQKRHLCYFKETPGLHLGRDLYDDERRGKMAESLVFASPKHMSWSDDPGFLTLPIESTSMYIFHGETPRPHTVLKLAGFAIEWETWGPDGNVPIIDSDHFMRSDTWKPKQGCDFDVKRKWIHCPNERLLVQPWASEYTYNQIQSNKQRVIAASRNDSTASLHFIGSIWDCNIQEFLDFTRGCSEAGINVVRHGKFTMADQESLSDLMKLPNFSEEPMDGRTKEEIYNDGRQDVVYAPAFQGSCHLTRDNPSSSYIADRILNLISLGIYPMTNNPSAFEYLGLSEAIVFNNDVSQLCEAVADHKSSQESMIELMETIAQNHTYVSRLSEILDFLSGPLSLNNPELPTFVKDGPFYGIVESNTIAARRKIQSSSTETKDTLLRSAGNAGTNSEAEEEQDTDVKKITAEINAPLSMGSQRSSINAHQNKGGASLVPECIPRLELGPQEESDGYFPARTPLVILSNARSGSNLFVNMIEALGAASSPQDLDVMPLYEAFGRESSLYQDNINKLASTLQDTCTSIEAESIQQISKEIFDIRFQDPMAFFRSMIDTPTLSRNPFFAVKVFQHQLSVGLSLSVKQYIDLVKKSYEMREGENTHNHRYPKFVVLWRRRMIESYVSEQIARNSDKWPTSKYETNATVAPLAIDAKKEHLQNYVRRLSGWFEEVRDVLNNSNLEYEVFQYESDLLSEESQRNTLKRLVDVLNLSDDFGDSQIEKTMDKIAFKKQSQAPLEKQVRNWDEVVEWGYGGPCDEWPNIFDTA